MKTIVAGALALGVTLATAQPVAAQAPAAAALQPGEVLLEIAAEGVSRAPADLVVGSWTVTAQGATEAEARAALDRRIEALVAAARKAGAAAEDVKVGGGLARIGWVSDPGHEVESGPVEMGVGPPGRFAPSEAVQVTLRDPRGYAALANAIQQEGVRAIGGPDYQLSDPAPQRRAAKIAALRHAVADAEAYAAATGMRVARTLRVSERIPADARSADVLLDTFRLHMRLPNGSVETEARIAVDFVLAPLP